MLSITLRCRLSPASHDCCVLLREGRLARSLKQSKRGSHTSSETTEGSTPVTAFESNHRLTNSYRHLSRCTDRMGRRDYFFSASRQCVKQFQGSITKSKGNSPSVNRGFRHTLAVLWLIGLFVVYVVCLSVQMLVIFAQVSASKR